MKITIEFDAVVTRRLVRGGAALALALGVVIPFVVFGSPVSVTVPNTFTSGTTISSAQVNANFTALRDGVNSLGQFAGDPAQLAGPSTNLVAAVNLALVSSRVVTAAAAPAAAPAGALFFNTTVGAPFYGDGAAFNRVMRRLPSTFVQVTNNIESPTRVSQPHVGTFESFRRVIVSS